MWRATIQFDGREGFWGGRMRTYGVSCRLVPIHRSFPVAAVDLQVAGTIFGERAESMLEDLQTCPRVSRIGRCGGSFVACFREPAVAAPLYEPSISFVKPICIDPNGVETLHLAADSKRALLRAYLALERKFRPIILSVRGDECAIPSLTVLPDWSERQRQVMRKAFERGYYECPRRCTIRNLANELGASYSTVQAHLRKAERRLVGLFFEAEGGEGQHV